MNIRPWAAILVALSTLAMPAAARMYQWVDPHTRTTQLSGHPPAWYRSGQPGPRVFVIENGQVVDDTARAVPQERMHALREQAFSEPRPGMNAAPTPAAEPTAAEPVSEASQDGAAQVEPEDRADAPAQDPQTAEAERLKAIIDAWDRLQTDRARRLLESRIENLDEAAPR
ncbi:MAG: hypothetical protein AB7Q97_23135 [Gammaproteobacteria bacterium]